MASHIVNDEDDDVVFVKEEKSPTVKVGRKNVPIRNIDIVNDQRTKRIQNEKQKKRKLDQQSPTTNTKNQDRGNKKIMLGNNVHKSSNSSLAGPSNGQVVNHNLTNAGNSQNVLDYFKFLDCQGKENPCDCKEFEPMPSDDKQCSCGHRRGNHKKIDRSEWEKSLSITEEIPETTVKESTTITNDSNDSNLSLDEASSRDMDIEPQNSSSENEGPVAGTLIFLRCSETESSPLKSRFHPASPAVTPIRNENSTVIDVSDSDAPPSNNNCIRLDIDSESDNEVHCQRPRHYPMTPYYCCPPLLKRELGTLSFKKRIVVEKFISTNELTWSFLDEHTFQRIKNATRMDEVIQCVEDKIKDKKQSRFLVHLGEVEKDDFNHTNNRAWLMNATVDADNIQFEGPYMEETNRVIREYGPDRFLRVSFKIAGEIKKLKKVFLSVLRNGIWFAGRFYEFLCFSASQLREQKCYFFASQGIGIIPDVETAADVRHWLGKFDGLPLPKLGARLGQPFSRTTPTVLVPREQVEQIDDIEYNGYCFTDGCGYISPEIAKQVADKYGLEDVPSAFQVRWGPCKGVLMLNNNIHNTVHFRKSMWKYQIPHPTRSQQMIEVIKYSRALKGHLNRQFIVLLEGLGVPTEYFVKLQDDAIRKLLDITQTKKAALSCLQSDDNADSLQSKAVGMLLAGHTPDEPYLRNLLLQIQENQLNQIKEKARIHVPNSRILLGVCDSSGLLKPNEGNQVILMLFTVQVFVQIQSGAHSWILHQNVAVSKNPCVHPGDFRLLQAVDIPELRHLVDVIVFPVTGERPIADQIAGGDLDGDQFFVTWDTELTKIDPYPPMDYRQQLKITEPAPENYIPKLQEYFVDSMFSTALGVISNLHTKFADLFGPKDPIATELAELHSKAVDAAKTGEIVEIPEHIKNHKEKKWPHFMGKEASSSYTSKRCLGVLYDKVLERLQVLRDRTTQEVVMDEALLLKGREVYAADARKHLREYNSKMTKALSISDADLKSKAIENIILYFRKIFESEEENDNNSKKRTRSKKEYQSDNNNEEPPPQFSFTLCLKASAWYEATYQEKKNKDGKQSQALTFAWNICDDYLNRIKADSDPNKRHGRLAPTVGTVVVKELCFK